MCGIVGFIRPQKDELNDFEDLTQMNNSIHSRGPDDQGMYLDRIGSYSVGLAMKRLSIIDVSNGSQPIKSWDNQIVLTFNGEIYNYRRLRQELQSLGVHFKTNSDTEVILRLYENYGIDGIKRLDGMFAIAILDKEKEVIHFSRDHFGEKPLYLYQGDGCLYWASELKAIRCIVRDNLSISMPSVTAYFQLFYIPSPNTIYNEVVKIKPNTCVTVSLKSLDSLETITKDETVKELGNFKMSYQEAIEKNRSLLFEIVESRLESDVPVGAFLSGGVDSSIVSFIASRIKSDKKIDTFTIGFEKKEFNESKKAQLVSDIIGSNHHEFTFTSSDMLEIVDEVQANFDEPFADMSSLATYLISKKTAEHVKVALTGDGGDELYGGYNKYRMSGIYQSFEFLNNHKLWKNFLGNVKPLLFDSDDTRGLKFKLRRVVDALESG